MGARGARFTAGVAQRTLPCGHDPASDALRAGGQPVAAHAAAGLGLQFRAGHAGGRPVVFPDQGQAQAAPRRQERPQAPRRLVGDVGRELGVVPLDGGAAPFGPVPEIPLLRNV